MNGPPASRNARVCTATTRVLATLALAAALVSSVVCCTSATGPSDRGASAGYTDADSIPVPPDAPLRGTNAAPDEVRGVEVGDKPARDDPNAPREDTVRYLALGDSYTIGESVPEEDRYPVQLVERLHAEGVDISSPEIIARTGWTTDDLSRGIDAHGPQGPYGLVTLLIGVNNQYRGRPLDSYTPGFVELLERSIGFAGGDPTKVVVISIPDYGATPFGQRGDPAQTGRELDAYNAAARTEVERLGAHWVDITPESREAVDRPDLIARDGLHPSGEMYAEWVELMLPSVRRALDQ
jgi:lysophospholipase L1-like esterase